MPAVTRPIQKVARVVIDSPLPNLDRLFDYSLTDEMVAKAVVGARVKVPFGSSKALKDAFIVDLVENSDYEGKLSKLAEVVSPVPVLPSSLYQLLKGVAERQASTLGDLLKLAIAKRSVAVEKKFISQNLGYALPAQRQSANLTACLVEPRKSVWVSRAIAFAERQVSQNFSAILLVPDFRDLDLLRNQLTASSISFIDFSTNRKASERYQSYLECLQPGAHIVIGSRNSVYAPLVNLGGIYLFDDGDDNLVEQSSPYVHSRDVALVRQSLSGCDLAIEAHYRSTEAQRLVEIGYLKEITEPYKSPNVAVSEDQSRLPTMAWQAIRETVLGQSRPVLIQVVGKGVARSTYCYDCGERAKCKKCNGPIWIDGTNTPKCRWCSAIALNFTCHSCSGQKLKQGSGGATRTSAEIGKSFPGAQIIESTGDSPIIEIKPGKRIVVSTPGAEPRVEGGYGCVVILDAATALAKDSLRAQDLAVRNWTNAIAHAAVDSRIVISGIPQHLGQQIALWQLIQIASDELNNRRELDFPPALRLASVQGEKNLTKAIIDELNRDKFQILGPISLKSDKADVEQRYVIKYSYSNGSLLARELKAAISKQSSGTVRTGANGRTSRAIRLRMDDPEVI